MDPKKNIELEELLRLKRHEKPEPEFWEKFDQGLRRKSMQALVAEKRPVFERRWFRQLAVASAFVFCGVPTYLGVQSYYADSSTEEASFQVAVQQSEEITPEADLNQMVNFTRELAIKKKEIENRKFVVDAYAIDPKDRRFSDDTFYQNASNQDALNRVYVNDRVKLLQDSAVLPVNYNR